MPLASRLFALALLLLAPARALAAQAPFDLAGPKLKIAVTRGGRTLPISQIPTLSAGDQLQIQADLPEGQSVHYLLVAAFLRGATNPPPDKWISSSETWKPKQKAGLKLTVPEGAQQIVLFLAPETGGDFDAVSKTIGGRPGAFVRASQDLNQASLDRSRLDAYLAATRAIGDADPERLKTTSPLLARSLTIKLEPGCLEKAPEARAACLIQGHDALVLDDGHSTSMVQALASGYSADLLQQLSATPKAGGGAYSPYLASILDIAHIMDGFRTAQYQYIPALVTQRDDQLALMLNAPPSFKNPMSVLLVALPPIEPPHPPPLRAVDPAAVQCLQPGLVLPAEGAPLAFSGGYAHHMALRLKAKDGQAVELPAHADAARGGFVVDTARLDLANFPAVLEGSLHGFWGFEAYEGPVYRLQNAGPGQAWKVAGGELIAGRDATVQLEAPAAACVESVMFKAERLQWKQVQPNRIAVTLPLADVQAGALPIQVKSFAAKAPDTVSLEVKGGAPRPSLGLISKNVRPPAAGEGAPIQLADADELPRGAVLTFSIRAQAPAAFSGKETVEVATANGAFATSLTTANGLTLQDSQVALASLDTGKAFNASAAGPLRFRLVVDGAAGDWSPLATLVRLPVLRELKCPIEADQACQLSGSNLFLLDSVAADPKFDKPVQVPPGFAGDGLSVPRPVDGKLYLKLRDAPAVVNSVSLPAS
jgi:hypothetical protein